MTRTFVLLMLTVLYPGEINAQLTTGKMDPSTLKQKPMQIRLIRKGPPRTYAGTVLTEWLPDNRRMRLLEDFAFYDDRGIAWDAPKGSIIDGASIPRIAWTAIGGPFEGAYRNASVIHDVACSERARPWRLTHEVFHTAMIASGVQPFKAAVMYAAVYHFGPRWIVEDDFFAKSTGYPREDPTDLGPAQPAPTAENFNTLVSIIEAGQRIPDGSVRTLTLEEIRNIRLRP